MATDYLVIPAEYVKDLGGLTWSASGDAIEQQDGRTFALAAEVLAFLEGFAAQAPLIHFGHVLHFLYLLRHGKTPRHDLGALGRAWREAGRPARLAGAFAAVLCREVPVLPEPPGPEQLLRWMNLWSRLVARPPSVGTEPPLDVETFEAIVACAVQAYSFGDLVQWFRHGRGPVKEQSEQLVRELLAQKPRSLGQILTEVSRHDRLSGAMPYVSLLIAAISLPPRRLFAHELPMGGYSDLSNRGQPDQLLFSQFALDEMEFLRRHAENELLYYRREQSALRTREDLVLLLDQGVRTWGSVRLALTAAVFSLAEYAQKKKFGLRIATTGNGGVPLDPLQVSTEKLAELLARSDFSVHPGSSLETLLEQPSEVDRDIVLLSHPRSLENAEVAAAARRLHSLPQKARGGGGSRLFSLGIDASGEATLAEWRHGATIPMNRFRLDLTSPAHLVSPGMGESPGRSPGIWSGSVEVIPYPFRFGLSSHVERPLFTFDHTGNWLLLTGQDGMLFAIRTDGTGHEILPRPLLPRGDQGQQAEILTDIHGLLGVVGGFVVLLTSKDTDNKPLLLAAHYDFFARHCQLYSFPFFLRRGVFSAEWRYLRRLHMLLVRCNEQFHSVLLATRQVSDSVGAELRWPVKAASPGDLPWQENDRSLQPLPAWFQPALLHDPQTGQVRVQQASCAWEPFTPMKDGEPLLKEKKIRQAICRGHVLGVVTAGKGDREELHLFQGPEGSPIDTINLPRNEPEIQLSQDGQFLALQRGANQVQLRKVEPGLPIALTSPVGRFHNNVRVELGAGFLVLAFDQTTHHLWWTEEELRHAVSPQSPMPLRGQTVVRAQTGIPPFLRQATTRFCRYARNGLVAVVSRHGEVFLFTPQGELLCGFFACKQQLAAWLPDGTYFGAEQLTGHPASPEACKRLAQVLRNDLD